MGVAAGSVAEKVTVGGKVSMGIGGGVALGTGVWVDVEVGLGSTGGVALGGRVQVGGISNVAEGKGIICVAVT